MTNNYTYRGIIQKIVLWIRRHLIAGIIGTVFVTIISTLVMRYLDPVLPSVPPKEPKIISSVFELGNEFELSDQCPHLDVWPSLLSIQVRPTGLDTYLPASITGDLSHYRIFVENNDEKEIFINNVFVEVLEYYMYDSLEGQSIGGRGGIADIIYYRTDLAGSVGKFPAHLCKNLSEMTIEEREDFIANPDNYKRDGVYASIEGLRTQGFEIFFTVKDPGVYRTRVSFDYVLGGQPKRINTTENTFVVMEIPDLDAIRNTLY